MILFLVKKKENNVPIYIYSGPSLIGHSQQRPQIVAAPTVNVFTSPSHQRPPSLMWPQCSAK